MTSSSLDSNYLEWLEIDWPRQQKWLEIDGRSVNVIEMGRGEPLLLIHGLAGSWQNWLANIPHLSRHYHVIALDLPGFGASEMPRNPITMTGYAQILKSILNKLQLERISLVGNSMGGLISILFALEFPECLEKLVLVDSAGLTIQDHHRTSMLALARLIAIDNGRGASTLRELMRRPYLRNAAFSFIVTHPERLTGPLMLEQIKGSSKPGYASAVHALRIAPVRELLYRIAAQTLVVWGEKDRLIPVKDADEFAQLLPNSQKLIFPDTGHIPMLEQPTLVNQALIEFIATGVSQVGTKAL